MISRYSRAEAGFTLLEIMVVMLIAGMLMALFAMHGTPVSPATEARGAARAISGALRSARSEAIMSNRSVSFTLDTANHRYTWGKRPVQNLPAELRLVLSTSQDETMSSSTGKIRFDPDGGSSGGRITISGGDYTAKVGVDWLSGRVYLDPKSESH